MYYSPAAAQAFPAHFDSEDIIAIQISGQKSWDLFEPEPTALFANANPYEVPDSLEDPRLRVDLKPGDLLYLPRGWTHRVRSHDEPSLHITFSIRCLRWADLLLRAAQQAIAADQTLQQALPLHRGLNAAAANARIAIMLRELNMPDGYDPYGELMTEVLKGRPPSLSGQSRSMLVGSDLNHDTALRRRDGLAPLVIHRGVGGTGDRENEVTILFAGNGVAAPPRFLPALELVTKATSFTMAEMAAAAGDDCRGLVAALITNGLLVVDRT